MGRGGVGRGGGLEGLGGRERRRSEGGDIFGEVYSRVLVGVVHLGRWVPSGRLRCRRQSRGTVFRAEGLVGEERRLGGGGGVASERSRVAGEGGKGADLMWFGSAMLLRSFVRFGSVPHAGTGRRIRTGMFPGTGVGLIIANCWPDPRLWFGGGGWFWRVQLPLLLQRFLLGVEVLHLGDEETDLVQEGLVLVVALGNLVLK